MLRSSGTNIPRSSPSALAILRRFIGIRGLLLLGLLYVSMAGVCGGGVSPFLSAQFAQNTIGTNLPNRPSPPPATTQPDDDNGGTGDVLASVCDLEQVARTIQIVLQNEAQQPVEFAMTFVVSAGPGGFVCDEELQNYLNAGYTDAIPPGQTEEIIGCDTVTLLTGTRLLTLEFGVNQDQSLLANTGGDGANTTLPLTTRTNNINIPVPELIVFGNSNPQFICSGPDTCSQVGFVYVSAAGLQVGKSVEAYRVQGTLCETGFGTAPEWRLDKTPNNNTILEYQYVGGSTIIADVLDRSGDTLQVNRNQVVWTVTDADSQNVIHAPNPGGGGG